MFQKSGQTHRQTSLPHAPETSSAPGESHPFIHGLSRIGGKTVIHGDISGDEDLLIEGRVTGNVLFQKHSVTVGTDGLVEGRMVARELSIRGRVEGTLIAAEKITLKTGAVVNGELHAPGLVLEEGAAFHGNIDMKPEQDVLKEAFEREDGYFDPPAPGAAHFVEASSPSAAADTPASSDQDEPVSST